MAVIHLGADFMLRTAYLPEAWPHRFAVFSPNGVPKGGALDYWTVSGPLCFAGDVLARSIFLPNIEVGDWVVIRDVGAYTLGLWSRHCSRGMPLVLGYEGDDGRPLQVLRRGETPADLVRFWSGPSGDR